MFKVYVIIDKVSQVIILTKIYKNTCPVSITCCSNVFKISPTLGIGIGKIICKYVGTKWLLMFI